MVLRHRVIVIIKCINVCTALKKEMGAYSALGDTYNYFFPLCFAHITSSTWEAHFTPVFPLFDAHVQIRSILQTLVYMVSLLIWLESIVLLMKPSCLCYNNIKINVMIKIPLFSEEI